MNLLLAIDSSQASRRVLEEVIKRPWPIETSVCVLNVLYVPALPISQAGIDALRQSADLLVKSAAGQIRSTGIATTAEVLEGVPQVVVLNHAEKMGADLVLLGPHGTSGLTHFLLGSVARTALRWASCSVEIVRGSSQTPALGPMKILLATDGSEYATAAAKSVASRPWPTGTGVRIISVAPIIVPVSEAFPWSASFYPSPELVETVQQETQRQAEEAVVRARQLLKDASVKLVESECWPVGDPREVILHEARIWGADLIVLGSLGHHGIERFMLGSVSESVAMHAHCSVEVIRPDDLEAVMGRNSRGWYERAWH